MCPPSRAALQRHKKTGEALRDDSGRPLALTSHTLAPVPVAVGGSGLPDSVIFRDDLPEAGAQLCAERRGCAPTA